MLLSCSALDSLRRLWPIQQCREQKFLGGQRRHGNRVMGWRRWHGQRGLEHIAERSRQGKLDGVESLQTALGAMPHSVLLGCHCLGIGLQDAAAAQETDGHRG
jgi:hypothetical protein